MSSSKAGWRADGGLVYNRSTGVRSPPPPPPLPQLALDPCQLAQATIAPTAAAENISLKADCEQSPPSSWAAGRDPTADDETAEALQSARCCCSHRALHRLLLLQRWNCCCCCRALLALGSRRSARHSGRTIPTGGNKRAMLARQNPRH